MTAEDLEWLVKRRHLLSPLVLALSPSLCFSSLVFFQVLSRSLPSPLCQEPVVEARSSAGSADEAVTDTAVADGTPVSRTSTSSVVSSASSHSTASLERIKSEVHELQTHSNTHTATNFNTSEVHRSCLSRRIYTYAHAYKHTHTNTRKVACTPHVTTTIDTNTRTHALMHTHTHT